MPASLPTLSAAELRRYSRQILLGEIGLEGQRRLAAARVLVIGAGGLGSPTALYLAAAGIGTLGIADHDRVEEHNLHRQLLHTTASVGETKVTSAAQRLQELNPHCRVIPHADGITPANAVALFTGYDVIVDGTDNFATRYLNNDAAFFAQRPLVYGSIYKFEGQVSVFDPAQGAPCYRCLFPEPPPAASVPGCGEAGVLGPLCGIIGSMQAMEVIKLITGAGAVLHGRLTTYNALTCTLSTLHLARDPACPLCGSPGRIAEILAENYTATCAETPVTAMSDSPCPLELSVAEACHLLGANPGRTLLIDVRESFELEICRLPNATHIPMRQIPEQLAQLPRDRQIFVLCHHGGRSLRVTQFLRQHGLSGATNITGGIDAWAESIDPTLTRY
ncbi:MAG: molybdopterin-synthase adenylyltransferase MoeB [Opitutaceae bacterium]|nr:molybdopterin-synthase adenylyltransferase MoeB [Opitutaceae bacterium]MBP9912675.1 molybdopterin-synthase adenylyltransferase MoeB [Opitutaceae bacterium]